MSPTPRSLLGSPWLKPGPFLWIHTTAWTGVTSQICTCNFWREQGSQLCQSPLLDPFWISASEAARAEAEKARCQLCLFPKQS